MCYRLMVFSVIFKSDQWAKRTCNCFIMLNKLVRQVLMITHNFPLAMYRVDQFGWGGAGGKQ